MTSEGNSTLLPANVDQQPPLQRGFMNFQLYNKSLEDWSLRETVNFASLKSQCFHWHSRETKLTIALRTSNNFKSVQCQMLGDAR